MLMLMQSRLSSSRLPAKALLPIRGIPSAVLAALRASNHGGAIRVITSTDASDDLLDAAMRQRGFAVYRGDLDDVLARTIGAVADQRDDAIAVRLTADNMLPDQVLIESVVNNLVRNNLDYSAIRWPESDLPYGLSVEAFRIGALRQAHSNATSRFDRENTTPWLRRNARCSRHSGYSGKALARLRCTLDTYDDYLAMSRLFDCVSDPVAATWEDLVCALALLPESPPSRLIQVAYWGVPGDDAEALAISLAVVDASATARIARLETVRLLHEAVDLGVTHLLVDTGDQLAAILVGQALARGWAERVGVVARVPAMSGINAATNLERDVLRLCLNLGVRTLDALLLPAGQSSSAWATAQSFKASGLVRHVGLWGSAIDPFEESAELVLDRSPPFSGVPSFGLGSPAAHRVVTLTGKSARQDLF